MKKKMFSVLIAIIGTEQLLGMENKKLDFSALRIIRKINHEYQIRNYKKFGKERQLLVTHAEEVLFSKPDNINAGTNLVKFETQLKSCVSEKKLVNGWFQ